MNLPTITIGNTKQLQKAVHFTQLAISIGFLFLQCSVVVSQTLRRRAFQVAAFHTTSWKFIDSTNKTQPKMMVRKKGVLLWTIIGNPSRLQFLHCSLFCKYLLSQFKYESWTK